MKFAYLKWMLLTLMTFAFASISVVETAQDQGIRACRRIVASQGLPAERGLNHTALIQARSQFQIDLVELGVPAAFVETLNAKEAVASQALKQGDHATHLRSLMDLSRAYVQLAQFAMEQHRQDEEELKQILEILLPAERAQQLVEILANKERGASFFSSQDLKDPLVDTLAKIHSGSLESIERTSKLLMMALMRLELASAIIGGYALQMSPEQMDPVIKSINEQLTKMAIQWLELNGESFDRVSLNDGEQAIRFLPNSKTEIGRVAASLKRTENVDLIFNPRGAGWRGYFSADSHTMAVGTDFLLHVANAEPFQHELRHYRLWRLRKQGRFSLFHGRVYIDPARATDNSALSAMVLPDHAQFFNLYHRDISSEEKSTFQRALTRVRNHWKKSFDRSSRAIDLLHAAIESFTVHSRLRLSYAEGIAALDELSRDIDHEMHTPEAENKTPIGVILYPPEHKDLFGGVRGARKLEVAGQSQSAIELEVHGRKPQSGVEYADIKIAFEDRVIEIPFALDLIKNPTENFVASVRAYAESEGQTAIQFPEILKVSGTLHQELQRRIVAAKSQEDTALQLFRAATTYLSSRSDDDFDAMEKLILQYKEDLVVTSPSSLNETRLP